MKATGIVRKIDDLGRIVIPKEIRKTLKIKEGDSLEIYTDRNESVIFRKYSPIGRLSPFAEQYTEVLNSLSSLPVMICDEDCVIAVAGLSSDDFIDRKITSSLLSLFEDRRELLSSSQGQTIQAVEGIDSPTSTVIPIKTVNKVFGAVVAIGNERINETNQGLLKVIAEILAKQIAN